MIPGERISDLNRSQIAEAAELNGTRSEPESTLNCHANQKNVSALKKLTSAENCHGQIFLKFTCKAVFLFHNSEYIHYYEL